MSDVLINFFCVQPMPSLDRDGFFFAINFVSIAMHKKNLL